MYHMFVPIRRLRRRRGRPHGVPDRLAAHSCNRSSYAAYHNVYRYRTYSCMYVYVYVLYIYIIHVTHIHIYIYIYIYVTRLPHHAQGTAQYNHLQ